MTHPPNFAYCFGLKATGVFIILLKQDGFNWDPETKFQTIPS